MGKQKEVPQFGICDYSGLPTKPVTQNTSDSLLWDLDALGPRVRTESLPPSRTTEESVTSIPQTIVDLSKPTPLAITGSIQIPPALILQVAPGEIRSSPLPSQGGPTPRLRT